MLEFFEMYGADIMSMVVAITGAATALTTFIKTINLNKQFKMLQKVTSEKIEITQQGIVEAFKTAKIPSEWKISISNQVDKKLEDWAAKFLTMFEEHERIRTELAVANTKILAFTAAYNKLSDEEKARVDELIKEITDKDKSIEV